MSALLASEAVQQDNAISNTSLKLRGPNGPEDTSIKNQGSPVSPKVMPNPLRYIQCTNISFLDCFFLNKSGVASWKAYVAQYCRVKLYLSGRLSNW
jgi:hypothetical protein